MDILIRRFNGEPYVWKKAKFVNGKIMVDDTVVYERDIVSIRNDIRKQYVVCSVCGTYFKKGSKKIETHKKGCDDTHMCFDCRYLGKSSRTIKSQKYKLLENGKYLCTTKSEERLYCGIRYRSTDIDSQEARDYCIYNRCKNATMKEASSFFLEKPGAFDHIVTVDKIFEVGYKSARSASRDGCIYYVLNGRNDINVAVNELNIIDGFIINYKRASYHVCYSKKYDELYGAGNRDTYTVWRPYDMTETVRSYIKDKISALYN